MNPALVHLYLPWYKYERQAVVQGNHVVPAPRGQVAFRVAEVHHKWWQRLSTGARKLMARNVLIVQKADLVVAFPDNTKPGKGGTGHTMRVAEGLGVPVFDLDTFVCEDLPL